MQSSQSSAWQIVSTRYAVAIINVRSFIYLGSNLYLFDKPVPTQKDLKN